MNTFSSLQIAAKKIGHELVTASVGYELWDGAKYRGGFTTLDAAGAEINLISELQAAKDSEAAAAARSANQALMDKRNAAQREINAALIGATYAAVLINEKCVALVKTTEKRRITLAGGITIDGAPVNAQQVKISRAAKNLAASGACDRYCDPHLYNGEIFYTLGN